MPFGEYENFDACVAANSDKENPNAYCAEIMRRTEKRRMVGKGVLVPRHVRAIRKRRAILAARAFEPEFRVEKAVGGDKNQVFGWASVAITKDGATVDDLQGHRIGVDELETAAYHFVEKFRDSGEMHRGSSVGTLIESMVFTPEKMRAMGIPEGALPVGWWTGFKMAPDTFAKVKNGDYRMLSIQGAARLIPIE